MNPLTYAIDQNTAKWELVSTRMAAAHGLVRAPVRSRVLARSSATLRLELLLLNTIPQGLLPMLVSFFYKKNTAKLYMIKTYTVCTKLRVN
jgi:hypothetical protein